MRSSIAKALYFRIATSMLVIWLGMVVSVAWVIQHETEEIFDSSLQETAQRLLSLTVQQVRQRGAAMPAAVSEPTEHDEYLTYQFFNREGEMLLRSHAAPATPLPIPLKVGFHHLADQHFYVESTRDGSYWIKMAERGQHRSSTLYSTLKLLLLPLAILIPLSLLAMHFSLASVRRHILALDSELARRDSRDLDPLDVDALPTEMLRLGETLNSLMDRLRQALESERHFTANSAHELRTPIASAMAQLDVLREETREPQALQRVLRARAMLERLERMTVKLLQLARAESGTAIVMKRMDILPVIRMLIQDLAYRSERHIDYVAPEQPVWVLADVDALGIVLQNLLENADRHATPETPISVEVNAAGVLTIKNDCDSIPAEILAQLRQRFVRATQSTPGSGIGLSIVDTILGQCGASWEVQSPCLANGRGFAVSISFAAG